MGDTAIRIEERVSTLDPCPSCGKMETEPEALEPYGICRDRAGAPVLILFHCPCRTSRSLRWEDAPALLRKRAEPLFPSRGCDRIR